MSNSIPLSPAHGVNPTIATCFWCGQEKNEIALMGMLPDDTEAPRNMVLNYEPCETCKNNMKKGITLIGVVNRPLPDGRPAIRKGTYPTGRWAVITPDGIRECIKEPQATDIIKAGRAVIDDDMLMSIMPKH